jgi:hypothetical protein
MDFVQQANAYSLFDINDDDDDDIVVGYDGDVGNDVVDGRGDGENNDDTVVLDTNATAEDHVAVERQVDDGQDKEDEVVVVDWGDEKLFLAADKHSSLLGNVKKVERLLKKAEQQGERLSHFEENIAGVFSEEWKGDDFASMIDSFCPNIGSEFEVDLQHLRIAQNKIIASLLKIQEFNQKQREYLREFKAITAHESCGEAITAIVESSGEPITTIESSGVYYVRRMLLGSRGYHVLEWSGYYCRRFPGEDDKACWKKEGHSRQMQCLQSQKLPVLDETDDEMDNNSILSQTDGLEWPSSSTCDEGELVQLAVPPSPPKSKKPQPLINNLVEDLGSSWVNGCRRCTRFQQKRGSIIVNGLRRSARLM